MMVISNNSCEQGNYQTRPPDITNATVKVESETSKPVSTGGTDIFQPSTTVIPTEFKIGEHKQSELFQVVQNICSRLVRLVNCS